MVNFTPRPLYLQEKSLCYPLDRMDGPQNQSERDGEEKNSQPLPGMMICTYFLFSEGNRFLTHSLVLILTFN
jgi:hypothetical protein